MHRHVKAWTYQTENTHPPTPTQKQTNEVSCMQSRAHTYMHTYALYEGEQWRRIMTLWK